MGPFFIVNQVDIFLLIMNGGHRLQAKEPGHRLAIYKVIQGNHEGVVSTLGGYWLSVFRMFR
jgi:hypothetical protein